jgi:hypothetical protein
VCATPRRFFFWQLQPRKAIGQAVDWLKFPFKDADWLKSMLTRNPGRQLSDCSSMDSNNSNSQSNQRRRLESVPSHSFPPGNTSAAETTVFVPSASELEKALRIRDRNLQKFGEDTFPFGINTESMIELWCRFNYWIDESFGGTFASRMEEILQLSRVEIEPWNEEALAYQLEPAEEEEKDVDGQDTTRHNRSAGCLRKPKPKWKKKDVHWLLFVKFLFRQKVC